MDRKVLLAMSGGVDSSVAAVLLMRRGFAVDGATMRLFSNQDIFENEVENSRKCCTFDDIYDASSVCATLNIDHFIYNFTESFKKNVIQRFVDGYFQGETPNPCLFCNHYMKFGNFAERAELLGYNFISTGHYARITHENGRFLLKKGVDPTKDQSYALYMMTQEMLSKTLLPVGEFTKTQIREIAKTEKLDNHAKRDSQDICFVQSGHLVDFLKKWSNKEIKSGNFLDINGKTIGTHEGAVAYTIGQRRGTNFSSALRLYVREKNMEKNTVTLCEEKYLYSKRFAVCALNLIATDNLTNNNKLSVKIRYNGKEFPAKAIQTSATTAQVEFDAPQRAITSGQAAVFYDGETVVGGGIIAKA